MLHFEPLNREVGLRHLYIIRIWASEFQDLKSGQLWKKLYFFALKYFMFYLLGELRMQIFNKEIDLTCGMQFWMYNNTCNNHWDHG